jgi:hypothetical protein
MSMSSGKSSMKERSTLGRFLRAGPIEPRFWAKVDKSGDCWIWTAATRNGYGDFGIKKRMTKAHRVAWELTNGKIPAGIEVAHRCDVRLCVNPSHLFLATHAENMRDMAEKKRSALRERNHMFREVPAEVSHRIVSMRSSGVSWRRIGRELGMSVDLAARAFSDVNVDE